MMTSLGGVPVGKQLGAPTALNQGPVAEQRQKKLADSTELPIANDVVHDSNISVSTPAINTENVLDSDKSEVEKKWLDKISNLEELLKEYIAFSGDAQNKIQTQRAALKALGQEKATLGGELQTALEEAGGKQKELEERIGILESEKAKVERENAEKADQLTVLTDENAALDRELKAASEKAKKDSEDQTKKIEELQAHILRISNGPEETNVVSDAKKGLASGRAALNSP